MAVLAGLSREHMISRFGGRADPAASGVTADTVDGGALKHAADVAAFAIGCDMRSV